MGYKPSPYNAVRHLSVAMEYAKEDPLDENNPFFWNRIVSNLPYSDSFNPGMP